MLCSDIVILEATIVDSSWVVIEHCWTAKVFIYNRGGDHMQKVANGGWAWRR